MTRERWAGLALLVVAPWALVSCAHENDGVPRVVDRPACGRDVPVDPESIRALMRPGHDGADLRDYVVAIECDGEVTAAEERCLRTPWARIPQSARVEEFAASPEEAVRASAGRETVIAEVLTRTDRRARIAVLLEGDEGVYDVQRVRRGWVVVAGEGCATGAASWLGDAVDEEVSEECQRALDEATPGPDGIAIVGCVEEVPGEEVPPELADLLNSDLPPGFEEDDRDQTEGSASPTCAEGASAAAESLPPPDSTDAFAAQLMVCDE